LVLPDCLFFVSFVVVDSSAVREVVVGNPEAERLIAGVEAGLRALLQRRRQILAGFQVVGGVLERQTS